MTEKEITELIGKFVKILFNGRHYPSKLHCYIRSVENGDILVECAEGLKRTIWVKGVKSINVLPDPKK